MTTCYDCRSNAPLPDGDVCQACLDLAAELDYEEKYCRDEHGSKCRCYLTARVDRVLIAIDRRAS
jgi:hypothetical protein